MFVRQSTAAATAVVQYDLAGNTWYQIHDRPRILRRAGFVGGNSIGQYTVDLFYGTRKIGTFSNTTAGAVEPLDADMKWTLGNEVCPVGTPLHIIVIVAPTVSAATFCLDFAEI